MKTLILSSILFLTGCGTCTHACMFGFGPGNNAFESVANYYDSGDPCQYKGKPEGYQLASFCGANRNKKTYTVKDNTGKTIYKIQ